MFGINKNKDSNKIKVYMFLKTKKFKFFEVTPEAKDDNQSFYFSAEGREKGLYIIDTNAVQFYTDDKKPIFFYVEGIPNPIIFNFKKDIDTYIKAKRDNPEALVYGDDGHLIDLAYSSIALEMYKQDNFLKKLLSKMTPEQMKIIYMLMGLVALSFVTLIIFIFFKK